MGKRLRTILWALLSDTLLLPLAYAPGGSGALPYALGSLRRERLTEGNISAATDIRLDKRGHKVYAGVEMGVRSSTISDDTASPQAPADHRTDRTAALRVAFGRESMGLTYKAGARLRASPGLRSLVGHAAFLTSRRAAGRDPARRGWG